MMFRERKRPLSGDFFVKFGKWRLLACSGARTGVFAHFSPSSVSAFFLLLLLLLRLLLLLLLRLLLLLLLLLLQRTENDLKKTPMNEVGMRFKRTFLPGQLSKKTRICRRG
jgi:hypothetical protein